MGPSQGPASGHVKLTIKITLDCWGGQTAEGLVYGVGFAAGLWQEAGQSFASLTSLQEDSELAADGIPMF